MVKKRSSSAQIFAWKEGALAMKETIKRCRASQDSLLNKKETEKKAYAAAVYLRLSKEDGDVCDGSCSK